MKNRYEKLAGMLNGGEETRERFHAMLNTRLETDFELKDLFRSVPKTKELNRKLLDALFYQTPTAVTMAPSLQREMPVDPPTKESPSARFGLTGSNNSNLTKTASVDSFFAAHHNFRTEAQTRFPELLKAAADPQKVPNLKRVATTKVTGPVPVPSSVLSNGST